MEFYGHLKDLENPQVFETFLTPNYKKEWIVYCKPPFKTAATVVEYLGRYTHRVAISNNRILKLEDGQVSFKWRGAFFNALSRIIHYSESEPT